MRWLIVIALTCAFFVAPAKAVSDKGAAHQPTTNIPESAQVFDAGRNLGNIYVNDFLGFTYTFAVGWKLILNKDAPDADGWRSLVLATPATPPDITAIQISSEEQPQGLTAQQVLSELKVTPPFQPNGSIVDLKWGGHEFARHVYSGKVGGGRLWDVTSVTFVKGYALKITLVTNTAQRFKDFTADSKALSFSVPTSTNGP